MSDKLPHVSTTGAFVSLPSPLDGAGRGPGLGKRLVLLLATGFGLGYSPVASGTFGTLPGFLFAAALAPLPWLWQASAALALALAAIPVCGVAERHFGRKDDGRIVADEYLTLPLCLVGIPWTAAPVWAVVAFLAHRVLDIIKPPPARQAQVLRGGLGIAADDLISGLYALAVVHILFRLFGAGA